VRSNTVGLLFLTVTLLISPKLWAEEDPHFEKVAIGIASPGPGVSMFGHAFLLFLNDPKKKSESLAAQYNISEVEGQERAKWFIGDAMDFLGYSKRFQLQIVPGLAMIDQYRMENRSVLLFYLRLTPQQISQLLKFLKNEMLLREKNLIKDYSFMDHNCLTEALRAVNTVVPNPKDQLFFFNQEKKIMTFLMKGPSTISLYLRNSPFVAASHLAKQPLVISSEVIQPEMIAESSALVHLHDLMLKFSDRCEIPSTFKDNIGQFIGKREVRESLAFLNFLNKKQMNCPDSKETYNEIISLIYMLADTLDEKMKIEEFFL